MDMLNRPNVSRSASYLVPCVLKAVQLMEILRSAPAGLRVEDLRSTTRYSRSMIYRILRTLTACEYVIRGAGGLYRLKDAVLVSVHENARLQEDGKEIERR